MDDFGNVGTMRRLSFVSRGECSHKPVAFAAATAAAADRSAAADAPGQSSAVDAAALLMILMILPMSR